MPLDVKAPDPPALNVDKDASEYDDADVVSEADYRREELKAFLEEGAWTDAWEEWTATTDLTEEEFTVASELALFERYDFFWDDFADRVGYHAPGIPEDWRERDLHPDLDSWETVSGINAALAEFGDTVSETLKENYIDWEADYDAPDDLPEF